MQLGIPPVAGAFLAGFALANFPVNGVVRGLLLSLTDFFQAIFIFQLTRTRLRNCPYCT